MSLLDLFEMLRSARLVRDYTRDLSWLGFAADPMVQDAVVRRLDLISRAAVRLGLADGKAADTAGLALNDFSRRFRPDPATGRLTEADLRVLWLLVQHDVPKLIGKLSALVEPAPDADDV